MHILILGIGDNIPTFILKRLLALDKQGVNLIIETSKENKNRLKREFSNSIFIIKPKVELSRIDKLLFQFLLMFLNISITIRLIRLSPHTKWISTLKWSYENFHLIDLMVYFYHRPEQQCLQEQIDIFQFSTVSPSINMLMHQL